MPAGHRLNVFTAQHFCCQGAKHPNSAVTHAHLCTQDLQRLTRERGGSDVATRPGGSAAFPAWNTLEFHMGRWFTLSKTKPDHRDAVLVLAWSKNFIFSKSRWSLKTRFRSDWSYRFQMLQSCCLGKDSCRHVRYMLRALYIRMSHLRSPGVQETRKPRSFEYTWSPSCLCSPATRRKALVLFDSPCRRYVPYLLCCSSSHPSRTNWKGA